MKNLLFPHSFQKVGWAVFAIGVLTGAYILLVQYDSSYTLNNVAIISICVGALLATCSREKQATTTLCRLSLSASFRRRTVLSLSV